MTDVQQEVERSLTPKEFCAVEHIGKNSFLKLRQMGLLPEFYWVPGTTIMRLTAEKHREWREKMQALTVKKAKQLEAMRRRHSERSKFAGARAAASPRHVSNRLKRAARRRVV